MPDKRSRKSALPAHVRIVAEPEAPRFVDPLLGVVDADAWAAHDAPRRDTRILFEPDAIAQEVGVVERAIDAECDTQFAWSIREIMVGMLVATLAHQFDSFDGLKRADQNRVRNISHV